MHAAPPVRIDLVPDRAAGWAVLCVATLSAANMALWLGALAEWQGAKLGALGIAAALAVLACLRGRRPGAEGVLAWDGRAWQWLQPEDRTVQPRVMLDLGAWMLLRLEPLGGLQGAIWGVATRARACAAWPAWRAALLAQTAVQPLTQTPT